ncbi:hypothetical protein LIG30_1747 [Burkholderia sp. lig30]|jgi:hypothetical protein|uniref:hypothetical protein n=1 Tax=Burkholderia sp. lig30 TaxID=1192124 RepID=UPI00046157A7|nr:hypothetical protein [Burkholderia sp. lig30]KDB09266.1 hypothetical protein LIG30_1747 [Burkholderia sp. lig30]
MKRLARITAAVVWIAFASLALTYWWIRHPDLIPSPPLAFSLWLDRLFGAHDCESSGDVDLYYSLIASVLIVSLLTFACWRLFRWRHN